MKKLLKKMINEKVAKGRIIGLAGPCYYKDSCDGSGLNTSKNSQDSHP